MERMIGGQTDVGRLRRVAVKHVRDAFVSDASLERQWQDLRYRTRPDLARAVAEYEAFLELLRGAGTEVYCLPQRSGSTRCTCGTRRSYVIGA